MHGYIETYLAYAEKSVGQTRSWHIGTALAIASAVANGNNWVFWGREIYSNLWIMLVGGTGRGKTTVSDYGIDLIHNLDAESGMDMGYLMPGVGSGEYLLDRLQKHPKGLMYWDEASGKLKELRSKEYMAGLLGRLTSYYTSPKRDFASATKSGGLVWIERPCISILGSSTKDWLLEEFNKFGRDDGFWRRFGFLLEDKTAKFSADPRPPTEEATYKVMSYLYKIKNHPMGEMKLIGLARKRFREFYNDFACDQSAEFFSFKGRIAIMALKIALIESLMDELMSKSPVADISLANINDGILIAQYFLQALPKVFPRGETQFQDQCYKLLDLIRVTPERKVIYSDALRHMGISDWNFRNIIETLEKTGQISLDNRDGKCYVILKEKE